MFDIKCGTFLFSLELVVKVLNRAVQHLVTTDCLLSMLPD